MGTCVAVFNFPGETSSDLSFQEGEVISIVEVVDEDWMRGIIGGRTGSFPKAYVKMEGEIGKFLLGIRSSYQAHSILSIRFSID